MKVKVIKKKIKIANDNLRGMFLDADSTRILVIDLPLTKETVKHGRKMSTRTFGELALMGDFHYGHEEFARTVLNGYLVHLKENPHIQLGLMGDYMNYAEVTHHKRDEKLDIDAQITEFCADFRPLKDRIRFILSGNHDNRFVRLTKSERFLRNLALEMGINPRSGKTYISRPQRGLYLVVRAGDKLYGGYVHHGSTNARINRKLQLKRMGSNNQVCFIAHGHTHELSWGERRTFRALEIVDGQVKNVVRRQYLLSTGCFLKYPSYAEEKSYPYTDVGCPIIRFYADQAEVEISDLTAHYKDYLSKGGAKYQGDRRPLGLHGKEMTKIEKFVKKTNKPKEVKEKCLL